jgi:prepilin signal peptidase PulO-like enzyme (type II secretory pathway)
MFISILVVLGLCFGSFVNALVFRLHMQSKQARATSRESRAKKAQSSKLKAQYSIIHGRSMCVECKHTLGFWDLLPVISWVALKGKCRYCKKPISWQYPAVELATAGLFVTSYIFWPNALAGLEYIVFGLWLAIIVGFMALIVYDIRWMLLPNRVVFPLYFVGLTLVLVRFIQTPEPLTILNTLTAVLVGGGLFYALFQFSKGRWIGGGDVKLGFLLGALVGRPDHAFLMLFIASVLGCLYILPGLVTKKLGKSSRVPFGPFLMVATIIVVLFGNDIIIWYLDQILLASI